MLWLWLFISGLILVIVLLLIKIHLLRKSAKEIECSFAEKLITDSNTLIDISSNDKYMCHLANEINIQLRKLRAERRKFQKGDIELKNAVTNVSHDLRTPLTAIYGYLDLLEQEEKSEKVNRYKTIIFINMYRNTKKVAYHSSYIIVINGSHVITSSYL